MIKSQKESEYHLKQDELVFKNNLNMTLIWSIVLILVVIIICLSIDFYPK